MPPSRLPQGKKDMPKPPGLRRLIGPSFIILGLGLGSGEVILWPYLASNYGLGMVWGMLIGITMQFFINMEVERYALIHGESIFVGFARRMRWIPLWFILSTFLGFGWPGIGLAGAQLLSHVLGVENVSLTGIIIFLGIGALLSFGKVLYRTVERLQMIIIGIGVPFVFGLAFYLADAGDAAELGRGLLGQGNGYLFLPAGIAIGSFLGALTYSGAGGNLNLAQSCYVRDKGYGMGYYADRITSVLRGGQRQSFTLTGHTFPLTAENTKRFFAWWKLVNIEHLVVFWLLGLVTMLLLSLLAYVTVYGQAGNAQGIMFVINEGAAIGRQTLPVLGTLFLLVTGVMLLATQLTVLDSTSRIMSENVLLLRPHGAFQVSRFYYAILWIQILFGITVFLLGFDQPRTLITLGAVLNGFAMFVYTGLLILFSRRFFAPALRPSMLRTGILVLTFLFLGYFCVMTAVAEWGKIFG